MAIKGQICYIEASVFCQGSTLMVPPVLLRGSLRAVIFDVIYTVVHNTARMMHYELLAAKFGISIEQLHSALDPLDNDFELGRISPFDRMRQVDQGYAVRRSDQEIQKICDDERIEAGSSWRYYEAVPQLLTSLIENGIKVGLCSNMNPVGRHIIGGLNLERYITPGAMVLSCEVGFMKPDPRIYYEACTRLRVEPSECLFVDDGGDHGPLAGAKTLGMRTAVVMHNDGYAYTHPDSPDVAIADFQLERVANLAKLFGIPTF